MVDAGAAALKPLPAKEAKSAGAYVRGPQPAMYLDPKSGATWSGRGCAPAWLANVKDRSKFLIAADAEATVATTAGAVSKAKAVGKKASKTDGVGAGKGQPKGAQPALYLDPKSGATWSGRGRAPAWLAGAKDRSKFLIGGAGEGKPERKTAVAKKASAPNKRAAVKKAATNQPAAKKTMPAQKIVEKKAAAKKLVGKAPTAKKRFVKKVAVDSAAGVQADAPAAEVASTSAGA